MEGDRRVVVADDAADHRVEAVVAGQLDQFAEQEPADALAPEVAPDVDRVLDRRSRTPGGAGTA